MLNLKLQSLYKILRIAIILITVSASQIAAQAPDINVQPTALDFGGVGVNDDSLLTISITNTGNAELEVSSIDVIGADASQFSLPSLPTFPILIQPGSQPVEISVQFNPASGGVKSGFLIIVNNDPDENPFDVSLSGEGVFPDIEPSVASLDFGELPAGSDSSRVLGIGNTGQGNLIITSVQLVGANSNEFAFQAPPLPIEVAPGASAAQITLTFKPLFKGDKVAFLSLVSNDPDENPLFIQLDGTATEADIRLSVEELDYGAVPVGEDSSKQMRIFNDGDANLFITDLRVNGGNANQFVLDNPPTFPLTILPGSNSGPIRVRFIPTSGGLKSSTLRIESNDPDEGQLDLPISGTGIEPDINVDVNPLGYGPVEIGDSLTIFFQISNIGLAPLIISDTTLIGNGTEWSVANFPTLPVTVPANGGRASLSVKFKPQTLGEKTATLQVLSNDPDENPFDIVLTGIGVQPEISASPDTLSFGNVLVKNDSIAELFISNSGGAPLIVSDTSITGVNASLFSFEEAPQLPITILPGANPIAFAIRFSPSELGEADAFVNFTSNDPNNPVKPVRLLGTGAAPELALGADTLDFGRVVLDSTSLEQLVIRNDGTFNLLISDLSLTGPDSTLFEVLVRELPISIAAGDSLGVGVLFSPIEERSSAVNMIIESNDPLNGELILPVIGQGALPRLSVAIDSLDFKAVGLNTDSTFVLALVNSGAAPLTIRSLDLSGINSPEFILKNLPEFPFQIPPDNAAYFLEVAFRPLLTTGIRQAFLNIDSNDRENPLVNIFLAGRGVVAPLIQSVTVDPQLGQDSEITVIASADTTLRQVRLRYGNANAPGFTAGALTLSNIGGGVFNGSIPGIAITSNGLKLEVAVSDEYPVTVRDTIFSTVGIPAGEIMLGSTSSSLSTLNQWQMFSLPYDAITDVNKSISSVLADLGEEGDFSWRIYRVDQSGQNSSYLNSTALNASPGGYGRFEPGNAFWLYLRTDDDGAIPTTTLSFPEMQTVSPDSFVYSLQPGWNQIGNPYSFPIPWDSVRSSSKEELQIYRWNGQAWEDSLGKSGWTPLLNQNFNLQPWSGYAVLNTTINSVNIVFDPSSGLGKELKSEPVQKTAGWQVILQAENKYGFDVNIAGMDPLASDEKDRYDYPDPSSPEGRGVSIVFNRNTWASENHFFATDIRALSSEGGLWTFGILGSGSAVDLKIPEMQNVPENFTVAIYDAKFERRYLPLQGETIALRSVRNDETERFSLYVGPEEQLNDALSGIERLIPNESALVQNYPNPFNPSTMIPYQVAREGRVTLRIYSVLGQLIRTLVNENQPAGYHEIRWDGRSDTGREAASGIYFYMLESAGKQSVKRLIKLK